MKPRALLFWEGSGWHLADVETNLELPGTFPELDDAIRCAHGLGFRVVDVRQTRGAVSAAQKVEKKA